MSAFYKIKVGSFTDWPFHIAPGFEIEIQITEHGCELFLYAPEKCPTETIDIGCAKSLSVAIKTLAWASSEPAVLKAWETGQTNTDAEAVMRKHQAGEVAAI